MLHSHKAHHNIENDPHDSPRLLTVAFDAEAEGRLQLADVILDSDVQAVDPGRGEGVVELQGVLIQHG